jgi:parallel beta-helix repeat protein
MMKIKSIVSLCILLFLAFSLCCSLQFISSVSANFLPAPVPEHSIEITVDGIEGTNKIRRNGNVYTFTENIKGNIVVFRNNIVINGAGYTLQGKGALTGIWLQAKSNVEIKNLRIRNFRTGIMLTYGWSQNGCTHVTISGNTITDNEYGIRFWMFSNNNFVLDNTIADNTYGVVINYSPNNVFRNNQMRQNRYNLWVSSEASSGLSEFVNDIDTSNTVDGKPVIYWVKEYNKAVPSDAGYVALVNCRNITVQNLVLTKNGQGVLLVGTHNSLIKNNYIEDNFFGIAFQGSFAHCRNNVISKNNITGNEDYGIYSWGSYSTNITGNSITNNQDNGIHCFESPNVLIVGNAITENTGYGVKLCFNSNDGSIYNNNFVNNSQSVFSDSQPTFWDNGTAGNYWDDYTGVDNDGDGIGESYYSIDSDNIDYYPLMESLEVPETEIPDVIPESSQSTLIPVLAVLVVAVIAIAAIYMRSLHKTKQRKETK